MFVKGCWRFFIWRPPPPFFNKNPLAKRRLRKNPRIFVLAPAVAVPPQPTPCFYTTHICYLPALLKNHLYMHTDDTAAYYDGLVGNPAAPVLLAALKKAQLNKVGGYCACDTRLNKERLVQAILGRLRESRLLRGGIV